MEGSFAQTVQLTTVDDFAATNDLPAPFVMKIDTEGFDCLVLQGSRKSLESGAIEVCQFEYNCLWIETNTSLKLVFDLVKGLPYAIGRLLPDRIEAYSHWHFELDRFIETNYVLVRTDSPLMEHVYYYTFSDWNTAVPQR